MAYVPNPAGTADWFRANPQRKDLFIKIENYDYPGHIACPDGSDIDPQTDCPFALGAAFYNAGVDVHVVSLDALPEFMGGNISGWDNNIDVARLINEPGTYDSDDGHIDKRNLRDWDWDTKGSSGIGSAYYYASATRTYQTSLDFYFADRPYVDHQVGRCLDEDGNPGVSCTSDSDCPGSKDICVEEQCGVPSELDPISGCLEDVNDNGLFKNEDTNSNKAWDGDHYVDQSPLNYGFELTVHDIDNNGYVELPLVSNPASINQLYEYTKAQVLKSTITHELGHAIGMAHTGESACIMYLYSINWSRDNTFSCAAIKRMRIHNN
jgi:hypothetical protein